ncbi:MAG: enoyl-CoA hydratase-related protein [Acidimicrobiia bacterium]|nr:MAG: enoyl-CoA hydratase-related protein [Acidimicrobiia bacterium]
MPFSNLVLNTSHDVATLTLNRPDSLNALSTDLLNELIEAAAVISESRARTVVVSGAGRAFCAGVDITMLSDTIETSDQKQQYAAFRLGGDMATAIESIPQVTVASLHGFVIGGGVVLAAACDLRIAAEDTVFSIPEIDLGIPLAWGGIGRLVHEMGPALTKELLMTGRRFTAQQAMATGFLNEVVAPDRVRAAAEQLASTIASKANLPIRMTKAHVAEVLSGDMTRDDAATAVTTLSDPDSMSAKEAYLAQLTARS